MGCCLTSVTVSSRSTAMTVLTTTSVATTYNNNTSSSLGGTRVRVLHLDCCVCGMDDRHESQEEMPPKDTVVLDVKIGNLKR
jgi:hypothetical protein